MISDDGFKTQRFAFAEQSGGSCRDGPIELVDHYFLAPIDRIFDTERIDCATF